MRLKKTFGLVFTLIGVDYEDHNGDKNLEKVKMSIKKGEYVISFLNHLQYTDVFRFEPNIDFFFD